jgi:hypothetical protein
VCSSDLDATANLRIIYKGNTAISPGSSFAVGEEIYTDSSTVSLDASSSNAERGASFLFKREPVSGDKTIDESATSQYQILINISFLLTSSTGAQAESSQKIKMDVTTNYTTKIQAPNNSSIATDPVAFPNRTRTRGAL